MLHLFAEEVLPLCFDLVFEATGIAIKLIG